MEESRAHPGAAERFLCGKVLREDSAALRLLAGLRGERLQGGGPFISGKLLTQRIRQEKFLDFRINGPLGFYLLQYPEWPLGLKIAKPAYCQSGIQLLGLRKKIRATRREIN